MGDGGSGSSACVPWVIFLAICGGGCRRCRSSVVDEQKAGGLWDSRSKIYLNVRCWHTETKHDGDSSHDVEVTSFDEKREFLTTRCKDTSDTLSNWVEALERHVNRCLAS